MQQSILQRIDYKYFVIKVLYYSFILLYLINDNVETYVLYFLLLSYRFSVRNFIALFHSLTLSDHSKIRPLVYNYLTLSVNFQGILSFYFYGSSLGIGEPASCIQNGSNKRSFTLSRKAIVASAYRNSAAISRNRIRCDPNF